jgi:hypothetical protein
MQARIQGRAQAAPTPYLQQIFEIDREIGKNL